MVGVTEGTHRLTLEDREWRLRAGQVAILAPEHPWKHHLAPASCLHYAVGIVMATALRKKRQGGTAWRLGPGARPQPPPCEIWGVELPVVQPSSLGPVVMRDLERICDLWWRDDVSRLRANLSFAQLLLRAVVAASAVVARCGPAPVGDELVAQALALLHGHSPPRSVAQWARQVGLHRNRFSERFLAAVGETPAAHLRRARLHRAEILLADTEHSLDLVASESGYRSADSLGHAFAAARRCSPRQWRQRQRL